MSIFVILTTLQGLDRALLMSNGLTINCDNSLRMALLIFLTERIMIPESKNGIGGTTIGRELLDEIGAIGKA